MRNFNAILCKHENEKAIVDKVAAKIWCQYHGISEAQLYDDIADDPSIVSCINRLFRVLKQVKPSLVA